MSRKRTPRYCVVDTNVATTANRANDDASPTCVAACARALAETMVRGRVYIDDGGLITDEYRRNLSARGEPGPGDAFLKWLLTHEWSGKRVVRVPITSLPGNPDAFEELPDDGEYDPSDRKFLAVAAAHPDKPAVLQALDSKWWGWRQGLREHHVRLHFLCRSAIREKYAEKMVE